MQQRVQRQSGSYAFRGIGCHVMSSFARSLMRRRLCIYLSDGRRVRAEELAGE